MSDNHLDPVCGMTVDPEHAAGSSTYRGQTIYFCGLHCKKKFDADPAAYAGDAQPADAAAAETYVCPMDPEMRKDQPGACPKCGMALEPERVSAPAAKVEWTCPMHPEVVRDGPGSCPICGMALESRTTQ
ncbi:MAG TPA: heavy metal-binding domain-containing protein, partial [Thermoanaerobaculia bacterium]|nr:heavy metal-binding domain-containing protein [Thermoanaerobaculia bacterium]